MKERSVLKEIIKNVCAVFLLLPYYLVPFIINSVIVNCNEKWFFSHYELIESVLNICIFTVTLLILLHFKGNLGKLSLKSFIQGLVFSLPIVLFCIYFSSEAIKWIFFDKRDLYYSKRFVTAFCINVFWYITVGLSEEMVFRCGFLNYLLDKNHENTKKRECFACIYSSFLFGIVHFMNYFSMDMEFRIVLYTVGAACLVGYIFAVIFLKTKNLAVVMILHSAWDFTTYCNEKMIVEKYRYSGSYNFYHYQVPVLIVMSVVATVLLYKSRAEELALHMASENSGEDNGELY